MNTRRRLVPIAWIATVAIALAAGAFAARATLAPPSVIDESEEPILYTVGDGTVSRTLSFTATAHWRSIGVHSSVASGTVTTIDFTAGQVIEEGSELYSINLRPVIVVQGEVPAFRDLELGVKGHDVEQLQSFLARAGIYDGATDGDFDSSTAAAVREWQEGRGVAADGIVRSSDIIFVPQLPARLAPGAELAVGVPVSGGQPLIEWLPEAPSFTIVLSVDQADLVPLDADVVVHFARGEWRGEIASATTNADGELVLSLQGSAGSALCGTDCEVVPISEPALYRADVIAVPKASGPVVPAAALRTSPNGSVSVVTDRGEVIEVTIVASANGQAVVRGIASGTSIQLFGGAPAEDSAPAPSPS